MKRNRRLRVLLAHDFAGSAVHIFRSQCQLVKLRLSCRSLRDAAQRMKWTPSPPTAIDLAKNVFSVHGVDSHGKAVLKKTVSRNKLLECFASLPPCLIGMEACSGAHHWARALRRLGHDARIIAPRFVIPYRKSGKNDGNDAEAICLYANMSNLLLSMATNSLVVMSKRYKS
jgi:hypothetical protein